MIYVVRVSSLLTRGIVMLLRCLIAVLMCTPVAAQDLDYLTQPSLGVSVMSLEDYRPLAESDHRLPKIARKGVVVMAALPYSPAALKGVSDLDMLHSINGVPLETHQQLADQITAIGVDGEAEISVSHAVVGLKKISWKPPRKYSVQLQTIGKIAEAAMIVKTDDVAGTTFVEHRDGQRQDALTDIRAYFQLSGGKAHNLRLQLNVTGTDWLFAKTIILQSGETRARAAIDFFNWDTTIGDGILQEDCDVPMPANVVTMLQQMLDRPQVTFRLAGETARDRLLTGSERMQLKQVLDAYLMRGGKLPQ